MMVRIAICDDLREQLELIRKAVQLYFQDKREPIEVFTYENAMDFVDAFEKKGNFDIVLLDICMPDSSGIELAQRLHEKLPRCQVIFVSSFLDYATSVYDVEHVYFILKSQMAQRLGPALRRAMDALGAVRADLLLERDGASYRVPVSEVLYAERVLRKTRVVTTRGDFMTQRTPAQLLEESRGFIRCHQSYWVNLSRVRCIRDGAFVMESGGCIPISRTYQHPAREAFFRSLVDGESQKGQGPF